MSEETEYIMWQGLQTVILREASGVESLQKRGEV